MHNADDTSDLPHGARWSVALALGLRQGEALGLLWDVVDLDGTALLRAARVAMRILVHSHIALMLGTYSHVVPEIAEEAAERIQRALWD